MATRTIDMSACPCCCNRPDHIQLELDYGGTCGYSVERNVYTLPTPCEDILGTCYSSNGRVTVILDYNPVSKDYRYQYDGPDSDPLLESAWYECDPNLTYGRGDRLHLRMKYTPNISPCIFYAHGTQWDWPDGYCVRPYATATPEVSFYSVPLNFTLQLRSTPTFFDECWTCMPSSASESVLFCCGENTTAELLDWIVVGSAHVHVGSSYGVCVTEEAYNRASCTPFSGPVITGGDPCIPDAVECVGGLWLRTTIVAAVKARVTAIWDP